MPGNSENSQRCGFAIPAVVGAIVVSLGLVAMFQSVMSQQRSLDLVLEADLKSRLAADSGLEWLRMLSEKTRTKLQAERGRINSHLELYQETVRGHAFADIFATNLGGGIVSYVIRGSWESPSGDRTRTVFEGDMRLPASEDQAGQVLSVQELSSQPAGGGLTGVNLREIFESDDAETQLMALVQKGVRERQRLKEIQRARFLAKASGRRDLLVRLEQDPNDAILEEILKASTSEAIDLWLMRDFIQNLDSLPDNSRLSFQPAQGGLFGMEGETAISPQRLARLLENRQASRPEVGFLPIINGFKAHRPQLQERGRRSPADSIFTNSTNQELSQMARVRGGPRNLEEMAPNSREESPVEPISLAPDGPPQEFAPSDPNPKTEVGEKQENQDSAEDVAIKPAVMPVNSQDPPAEASRNNATKVANQGPHAEGANTEWY